MKRFIYIIANESNEFKIGIGKDPSIRIKQLQTGNPQPLKILYMREIHFASKVETNLHIHYKEYRQHGEWFSIPENFSYDILDKQITTYENNFIQLKNQNNPYI